MCANRHQLFVNVNAAGGSLRAELLDYHGKPVSGFTLADRDQVTSDTMHQMVTWKGRTQFTGAIGTAMQIPPEVSRALRIRFALENAHLFSFSC